MVVSKEICPVFFDRFYSISPTTSRCDFRLLFLALDTFFGRTADTLCQCRMLENYLHRIQGGHSLSRIFHLSSPS